MRNEIWVRETARRLHHGRASVREITEALREALERGENVEVEFPEDTWKVSGCMAYIGYHGSADDPQVNIHVCSTDESMAACHPGIEALMLAWAKECGEGVERGLDILRENAIHQLLDSEGMTRASDSVQEP